MHFPKIPQYIGITDFDTAKQSEKMVSLVPIDSQQSLMVGVMTSYKVLNGEKSSWSKVWLKPDDLYKPFIDHPKAFNTLHWADYEGNTSIGDLITAAELSGENLRAIQLDMIWPDPNLVYSFVKHRRIPVILQVGRKAMEKAGGTARKVSERLDQYGEALGGVLLDMSGGEGIPLDAKFLSPFVRTISKQNQNLRIAVAGGLGPKTLNLVTPLLDEYPRLSIDAQGQLRKSGDSRKPIDWDLASLYLSRALNLFP